MYVNIWETFCKITQQTKNHLIPITKKLELGSVCHRKLSFLVMFNFKQRKILLEGFEILKTVKLDETHQHVSSNGHK